MSPGDDLDSLVSRVDPDRWLSARFVSDAALRTDLIGLYAFDYELARAPRTASNALVAEVRLTWWSEAADEVFAGKAPRNHPGVLGLSRLAERGLTRADVEPLVDARYRELDPTPMTEAEALAWARDTGGGCARLAVRLLDPTCDFDAAQAIGAAWSLSWRAAEQADLSDLAAREQRAARRLARRLSAKAFPAVAHAVLGARRKGEGDFARKARVTWAVAVGRI
ncbi:squalene/phytoene synthase family protein [Phenylobacterium immobile]|uniref:squalene/phytoene synthase family protein n=1 Tax=Phenylobacterium immobile TaxID=21 RepID=UPI000ADB2CD0|nr:squalene/phytoene synthase family protein [Phenylobacterium immobile]